MNKKVNNFPFINHKLVGFLSEDLLHFVGRRVLCVADEGRI